MSECVGGTNSKGSGGSADHVVGGQGFTTHLCGSLLKASSELNHAWSDRDAMLPQYGSGAGAKTVTNRPECARICGH